MSGNADKLRGPFRFWEELVNRFIMAVILLLAGNTLAHADGKVHANPVAPCSHGVYP